METRRILLTSTATILCITMLMGVVLPAYSQGSPKYGGTLVIPYAIEPTTLNQGLTMNPYDQEVMSSVIGSLVGHDNNYLPIPKCALSWEMSADGKTWTFHLVQNMTWDDGVNFTSADVKYTFDAFILAGLKPGVDVTFGFIDTIETPDNYTVVFKLKYPFNSFLDYLDYTWAPILPKHLYEGTDLLNNQYNAKPVGLGPFMFKEWVKGDHITLVKNPHYYRDELPYLDTIVWRFIPDPTAQLIAFEKGEIDYTGPTLPGIPLSDAARLTQTRSDIQLTQVFSPYCAQDTIQVNMRVHTPAYPEGGPVNPLSNQLVRQALMFAINRSAIVQKVLYGFSQPAWAIVSNITKLAWAYNPDVAAMFSYDPNKANQLLDQAGYPKDNATGVRFSLSLYALQFEEATATLTLLTDQLSKVGITLKPEILDYATLVQKVYVSWNFDLQYHERMWTGPDPSQLEWFSLSTNIQPVAWLNDMGWNNSRVDQLLTQADTELNQTARAEMYKEVQMIAANEVPVIPLTRQSTVTGWYTYMKNMDKMGTLYGEFGIDEVYIDKATTSTPTTGIPLMWVAVAMIVEFVVIVGGSMTYLRLRKNRGTK
jgi:peptide/nickel transport system substrate-binding protein